MRTRKKQNIATAVLAGALGFGVGGCGDFSVDPLEFGLGGAVGLIRSAAMYQYKKNMENGRVFNCTTGMLAQNILRNTPHGKNVFVLLNNQDISGKEFTLQLEGRDLFIEQEVYVDPNRAFSYTSIDEAPSRLEVSWLDGDRVMSRATYGNVKNPQGILFKCSNVFITDLSGPAVSDVLGCNPVEKCETGPGYVPRNQSD